MARALKQYVLEVEIEELEDGRYIADCSDFEGCHAEETRPRTRSRTWKKSLA
jgi:hypothetical protein